MADAESETPKPGWLHFLAQFVLPSAIASLVASGVSIYSAVNSQNKDLREYSASFESKLTDTEIMSAFKGYDVNEEKAAAELLALQSLAVTVEQKRTVLLLGARLLNANTDSEATGQAAARLLTIVIDEDQGSGDRDVASLTKSDSFLNLVTAGYSNDYYNDDARLPPYVWTTLNGDQPITHEAKLQLLRRLTPANYDGWIHVITLATDYVYGRQQTAGVVRTGAPRSPQLEQPQAPIAPKTALNFLQALTTVSAERDVSRARAVVAAYVVPPPASTAPVAPVAPGATREGLIEPATLLAPHLPETMLVLKARLLRDRPPVEYVNPDGTFRKGSLGRVIGAVPPGACVKLLEPAQPILVFVDSAAADVRNVASDSWVGLIHLWIHVAPSSDCGPF